MLTEKFLNIILISLIGYLIGSIPFGLIITRICGTDDIRKIGSGNIGATNVLRTGNKSLALLTLILDSGKGVITLLLTSNLFENEIALISGFTAVLGHNFPIWLKFSGGKGVATTFGVLLVAAWPIGLGVCFTWFLVAIIFRYSSLSALIAMGVAPLYSWLAGLNNISILAGVLCITCFASHQKNIRNLFNGLEPKITAIKKKKN